MNYGYNKEYYKTVFVVNKIKPPLRMKYGSDCNWVFKMTRNKDK